MPGHADRSLHEKLRGNCFVELWVGHECGGPDPQQL